MDETSYRVLRDASPVVLQVIGRATYANCASVRDFFVERRAAGCREFIVDLKECRGVDSTFLGILAGLANTLSTTGGHLILARPGDWLLGNIRNLGLDRLLKVATQQEFETSSGTPLPQKDTDEFQQARMILDAHENLIKMSPESAPDFLDVVEFLKEHVAKKSP